jgi:hypothetical protein
MLKYKAMMSKRQKITAKTGLHSRPINYSNTFMKKIYLLVAVSLLFLPSCTKEFLTKDNPTSTTDGQFWKTEAQLLTVVNDLAGGLPGGVFNFNGNTRISFTGLTDDAVWTANFLPEINTIALGNATPILPPSAFMAVLPFWRDDYSRIRLANRFLENASSAYVDPADLKRYMLEVRAYRAFFHLELFLYYGEIPLVTRSITPNESDLKRNTRAEIIQFITSELSECAAGLPLDYSAQGGDIFNRVTKGGALTMKAVAFLNAGMYPQAAAAAKEVIDLRYYELYRAADPKNSYLNLFMYAGETNKERIISMQNGNHKDAFLRLAPPNAGGTSTVNPTAAMVNTYETRQGKTITELGADSLEIYKRNPNYNDNRDPRLKATIIYPGSTFYTLVDPFAPLPNVCAIGANNSSRTGFWVRKYADLADRTRPENGSLDFMVYRYADVLLMYVEALVESGQWNSPEVVNYLNQIRNRAGMPDVNTAVYNSEAKIRELYRRERRVELAFEGSRLFDMRRWRIADQVMNGVVYGATNPATGLTVIAETRKFTNKDWLWPIPGEEMAGNLNMVQNPGY